VFAIFSGWYYWVPKILGLLYDMTLSTIQYWILFIGVNLTFFPQHFLGQVGPSLYKYNVCTTLIARNPI